MRTPPPPRRHVALLLVALAMASSSCLAQKLPQHEVEALVQIASKLHKKWDFTVNPCSTTAGWVDPTDSKYFINNVTCDCNYTTGVCHVISIQLKGGNLTGVLPDEFSNLTFLNFLDLSRNYLSGSIPASWATLPLTNLSLLGNRISGSIPEELGNMATLQSLVLEANQLQGLIPAALGKLTNLNRFHVSGNNFSGELPESLGNLKNMTDFRIDGNPFSGKIPSFIGNWTNLVRLDMEGTSLEGPFPPEFAALRSITMLRVSDMKLGDGKFPPLQNMKNIQILTLRNLMLSGEIPSYIADMTQLKRLDLSFNNLTGPIPGNFDKLSASLRYMYLTNNMLNGILPSWMLRDGQINLDLSYNNFTGTSAVSNYGCAQGLVNLVYSYSYGDSSLVPTCVTRHYPYCLKAINSNLFINCGGSQLTIGGNEFEADISQFGASAYEMSPSRKWAYSSTGDFLDNVNATYIATNASLILNTSNPELYMTARLSPLSLRYYGLCLQKGNYSVTLYFAEIMFTNNETYSSLGRRLFDVYIQGQKVLQDFNIAEEAKGTGLGITRNFNTFVDGTLEIQFRWAGKGTTTIPQRGVYGPLISAISVTPNFNHNKLSIGEILAIVAASCVVILALFMLCWFFCRRKNAENNELRGLELQTGYFTLKQIKVATNNFDPENKIGEGGFGPVYKGVLSDGSVITAKQLSSKSKQGNREFLNEIGMISALQHPNLVKLFGCCVEGSQLLVIYEYMENNCLARALFGPERDRLNLVWQTRRRICLGIARGLAYLHEESRLKIVHRDIKATNILLDKDFNAKISDFGLAKLDEEENTHISTRIAGTLGYMAPEYAMRGYLTDKADVYSFGVVILEVVSGMSNTNYMSKGECINLLDRACVLQEQGSLLELVDTKLRSNYSKEEATQMLNLALICTNPSPTQRPQMSMVVSMLEGTTPVSQVPAQARTPFPKSEALEKISHDSQTGSFFSTDDPWLNSSLSFQNIETGMITSTYSSTSKLLPEH